MNHELLKLGVLTLRPVDMLDIVLVATVFYYLWKLTRSTRASRMWAGILILLAFGMMARVLNLRALSWILASLSAFWAVAFVILFQPELRRALSDVGRAPWRRHLPPNLTDVVVRACTELTARKWGAIILLRRKNPMPSYIESGVPLRAEATTELLVNIFAPGAPLHDGAVVIDGESIVAARCVLPVAEEGLASAGLRHRAGLAATQETDAVAIIVSEETGKVSVAADGEWELLRGDATELPVRLNRLLGK